MSEGKDTEGHAWSNEMEGARRVGMSEKYDG